MKELTRAARAAAQAKDPIERLRHLERLADVLPDVRSAALEEAVKVRGVAATARALGVTPQAVHNRRRRAGGGS